ncbi:glycosyltransferase family 2 protein [Flavobacterium paronense]|uniref:Glycosyltransferase family 2 protein n=1 Tax=Flavobacterium paronense TaxID=1392775 RepID=A0ABV5GAR0_9FLAO|nr:glycosyltransferase family 2 protein [Flavobacterium paronense]MDN3676709.1 glycosyltransferase family 2 protein [Flavobacterium paronense]
MSQIKVSFLISTKNRCEDLLLTLHKIKHLFGSNVDCVVFDDGSTDTTFEKTKTMFPEVVLLRNEVSKGYIYCRNKMLNQTKADFAISLDDDAHFLTENPLEIIQNYFSENKHCGLIATRIFWNTSENKNSNTNEIPEKVKGFVGCGHIWRMKAWREIPNYPEWYEFYGEENFASLQLLKAKWEVHYVPQIFVQHRVNLKNRTQTNNDFAFRYRRSLRADWYNYFLFFPMSKIPRRIMYSIGMQSVKIFKGNLKVVSPLFRAIFDLIIAAPKLISNRNALSSEEYSDYLKLNETKIYWKPEK